MTPMSKELWAQIKPLLDEGLELDESARAEWLQRLRERSPDVAEEVSALLRQSGDDLDRMFAPASRGHDLGQSLAGLVIGGYTLDRPIGRGGMGTVWLAHRSDGRFEGQAAVKLLNLALLGEAGESRFRNEASALARLSHPNIARLLDAGVTAGGQPFLILEYVEGVPIDRYADERRLTTEQRIRLMMEVLTAVGSAHAHLIVHRDIKPSNILVTNDGQVKLLDFGIARMLADGRAEATLTDPGYRALTPEYGAPEMITGQPVSTATDVYSAGVMLFVLLSGRHPTLRDDDTRETAIAAAVERDAAKLSEVVMTDAREMRDQRAALRGATPSALAKIFRGDLDHILARALRKKPTERYATSQAFSDDLGRFLRHEPVTALGESLKYRAGKFVRRYRTGVLTTAGVVLALLAGTAFSVRQMFTARLERDRAESARKRAEASVAFEQLIFRLMNPGDPPLTYEQLQEKGLTALQKQYRGEPIPRMQLALTFSQNLLRGRNAPRARELVTQAVSIADSIGNPEWQARTHCELAQVHVELDQPDSAPPLIGKARRFLASVRNPEPVTRDACDYAEGNALFARNKRDSAVTLFKTIVDRRERSGDTTGPGYILSLNDLGRAYNGNRQTRESRAISLRILRALREGASADPRDLPVLLYNASVAFDALGEYRNGRAFLGPELARSYREDSLSVLAMNIYDYAMFLDQLGETDSAEYWFRRAVETPARIDSPRMFTSQTMLARYAEAKGDTPRARAHRAVANGYMALVPRSPPAGASWVSARIAQARAHGDPAKVIGTIEAEFKAINYSPESRAQRLAGAIGDAAEALIGVGRYAEALPYAEHLERLSTRDSLTLSRSGAVGRAFLLQSRARLGLADTVKARDLVARSVEPLKFGYGEGHRLTREAMALRDALQRGR